MPKRWRALGVLLVLAVILTPAVWGVWRERWSGGSAKDTVGIIDISGTISLVGEGPLEGAGSAKDALQYLNAARESPSIGAVVVRINSGGGSAAASQELHRSILSVREAGKPVVISMAEAAASGGYYIAVAGDRILANPSTVTGSIGVIARYLNYTGFADQHGFSLEAIKTGPYKDTGNPTRPMTDGERAVIQALVDDGLEQFVEDVAAGRNLEIDQVKAVADGRILTGRQALALGLIDGLGGLEEAVRQAAELAGIEEPRIHRYRRPTPWYTRLFASALLRLVGRGPLEEWSGERGALISNPVPIIELIY